MVFFYSLFNSVKIVVKLCSLLNLSLAAKPLTIQSFHIFYEVKYQKKKQKFTSFYAAYVLFAKSRFGISKRCLGIFNLKSHYFRLLSIKELLFLFEFLVFFPKAGNPQGDTGRLLPIGERPSPPPCG